MTTPDNPTPNFYALNSGGHGDAVAKIKELFTERDEARRRLAEVEKEREEEEAIRLASDPAEVLLRDSQARELEWIRRLAESDKKLTALRNAAEGMAGKIKGAITVLQANGKMHYPNAAAGMAKILTRELAACAALISEGKSTE